MPAVPSSLLEPVWVEFAALLPARGQFHPDHPLGCHRRRIPDRVVFEHIVAALVYGCGYERVASTACSEATIRRRLKQWAAAGIAEQVHTAALTAYHRLVGLRLADVGVDGCITKAPCGGDRAGPSPVDRRKLGLKRSLATDAAGIPLAVNSAGANQHDSPLLVPTLAAAVARVQRVQAGWPPQTTVHLDAGYNSHKTDDRLEQLGMKGWIAGWDHPSPELGNRWVTERTHSWMNGYGRLRRCTDRDHRVIDFYLHLAAAFVTVRALIRHAATHYRWDTRPTTRRLK